VKGAKTKTRPRRPAGKARLPAAKLTPKQARFVEEYLLDLNATQAAIRAGFSARTANKIGAQLLAKPLVSKALEEALAARAARVQVKADDVLRELLRIATVDVRQAFDEHGNLKPVKDLPEDVARAIAGIDVDELWEGRGEDREQIGVTRKVKFWDKPRALELLGKHLKMFTEKVEVEAGSSFAEILKAARERSARR
jgi:phage terminase small subunit